MVLGGGPAGTSAATALAEAGFDVVVVDPLGFGGRLVNMDVVRDDPDALDGPAGWDLAASLGEAAMAAGVSANFGRAERVEPAGRGWRVTVDGDEHGAVAVLVATGCRNRPVPGDEDGALAGGGVSYCAVCDAQLFAGRPVVVWGGDVWAWTEVASLAPVASSVVWVDPTPAGTSPPTVVRSVAALDEVRTVRPGELISVRVEGSMVRAVEVAHGPRGRHETIDAAGVFGADATLPNRGPVAGVAACDEDGFVLTDAAFACPAQPGLFAAGEVRRGAGRSVAAAMAEGVAAAAALAAYVRDARR
jgi:thioredoxin reductase (NADPH)